MHPHILQSRKAALIVVDIQEAFRAALPDFASVAARASTAVQGFQILDIPVIVTEQYPKGLGRTAEEIMLVLGDDAEIFEKTAFSSCGADSFSARLNDLGVSQVAVCGIEAHICVNQTVHDLLDRGFQVQILTDAVASRFESDRVAGLTKMAYSGAVGSSVEMALFELMGDSKHEKFKMIQALVK